MVTNAMTVRGQPASQLKVEAMGTTRPRAMIAMVASSGAPVTIAIRAAGAPMATSGPTMLDSSRCSSDRACRPSGSSRRIRLNNGPAANVSQMNKRYAPSRAI